MLRVQDGSVHVEDDVCDGRVPGHGGALPRPLVTIHWASAVGCGVVAVDWTENWVLLSRLCHTLLINLPLSQRTSHCCSEKTFFMFQTFVSVILYAQCEENVCWKVASVRTPAQTWRHWAGKCSNSRAYSGLPSVFGPRKVTEMVTWPIILCTFSIQGNTAIYLDQYLI